MMMRLAVILLTGTLSMYCQTVPAGGAPTSLGAFVKKLAADQKTIWTSPFHMDKRQWLTTALPIAAGAGALIAIDRRAVRGLPNTKDQILWSGRVSRAGAAYTLAGATAIPIFVGRLKENPALTNAGVSGAEAVVDAFAVSYALKYVFRRERPDQLEGNSRFFHGGASFPSGHALGAWAGAGAIGHNRRAPRWVKVTAYATATAISLARIGARRHHPSDVLVGSTFGYFIGSYVIRKNEN